MVFAGDLRALWEMINFLEPRHSLVHSGLEVAACPSDTPIALSLIALSEPIIFKSVLNQCDAVVCIEFEVVAFISWLVRPNGDRVDVRSEH